jgi:hypothetical protein
MSSINSFDWFQPQDLPILFRALRKTKPPAILVGGQSLTFWVDFFRIPIPTTDITFLTQDADVLGSNEDAKVIASALNMGHARIPTYDDHTPSTGLIIYYSGGRKLMIDVMGMLCGLDNDEIVKTAITLTIPKYGEVSILHPRLVLISRISNLMVLPSKRDTNGITQAKLAVKMYRSFLIWYRKQLKTDEEYQELLLEKAEDLKKISLSDASIFVFKNYDINVLDSFPLEEVENKTFLEKQWPQINKWFASKVGQ